jgi:hypothetical protein
MGCEAAYLPPPPSFEGGESILCTRRNRQPTQPQQHLVGGKEGPWLLKAHNCKSSTLTQMTISERMLVLKKRWRNSPRWSQRTHCKTLYKSTANTSNPAALEGNLHMPPPLGDILDGNRPALDGNPAMSSCFIATTLFKQFLYFVFRVLGIKCTSLDVLSLLRLSKFLRNSEQLKGPNGLGSGSSSSPTPVALG